MKYYKMKPGTTISDIEKYAEKDKEKILFGKGGAWISKDAEFFLTTELNSNISLNIAFPKDLEKWDDFENVLVIDEDFCQPYIPFYNQLDNPEEKPFPYLKNVIEDYNEKMNSMPFLEKITSQ